MLKSVFKKVLTASAVLALGAGFFTGCAAIGEGDADYDAVSSERVALRNTDPANGVYNVVYIPDMKKLAGIDDYEPVKVDDYTHICLYSVKLNKSGKLAVTESFNVNKTDGKKSEVKAFTKRFPESQLKDFMNDIHKNHKNVKVVACFAGGDDGIVDEEKQRTIIYNYLKDKGADSLASQLADMVKKYNLDGVDLDWEYFSSYSKYNGYYRQLAQALRKKLPASEGYSLSVAFPVNEKFVDSDIIEMCNSLDVVSVMSYRKKHRSIIRDYYKPKLPAAKLTYGISYEKKDLGDSKESTTIKDASTAKSFVTELLAEGYRGIMAWDYKGDEELRRATCEAIGKFGGTSSNPVDPVDPIPGETLTVSFSSSTKILSNAVENFATGSTSAVIVSGGSAKIENGLLKITGMKNSNPVDVYVKFKDVPANAQVQLNTYANTSKISKITVFSEVDTEGDTRKSLMSSSRSVKNSMSTVYCSSGDDYRLKKTYGWIHLQYSYASGKSASSSDALYIKDFLFK